MLIVLCQLVVLLRSFFFFQAEDGIRDLIVTGVQTCALPICFRPRLPRAGAGVEEAVVESDVYDLSAGAKVGDDLAGAFRDLEAGRVGPADPRSGERRVGEEGRSPWSPDHLKKKERRRWQGSV